MSDNVDRFRERRSYLGTPQLVPGQSNLGTFRIYNTAGQVTSTQPVKLTGSQPSGTFEKCWDQNHLAGSLRKQKVRGSRVFRTGGPFCKLLINIPNMVPTAYGKYSTKGSPGFSGQAKWEYEGAFMCPDISFDGYSLSDYASGGSSVLKDNTLVPSITPTMENEAWNIRPKLERGSLANALFELREMPSLLQQTSKRFHQSLDGLLFPKETLRRDWRRKKYLPKAVADSFLANQFGWVPFVKDVVTMCDSIIFSEQYLRDLSAQNNTWVKRRRVSTETVNFTRLKRFYTQSILPNGFTVTDLCQPYMLDGISCKGHCDVYAEDSLHIWYEGSFKFYRPELDMASPDYFSTMSTVKRHMLLYGLRINPTHVWKAIPWSWAIDWMSNVGNLIQRADEEYNDGMVAKYLYIMHHKIRKIRSFHHLNFWSGALDLEFERFVETKQRSSASSPYGFVPGGSLSASQWSIIAALGLSKNVRF